MPCRRSRGLRLSRPSSACWDQSGALHLIVTARCSASVAESQCIKLIIGRLVKRDWLLIPSDSALEGMTTSNMSPMKTWYVVAMVLAPRPFVHKGRIGLVPSLGHATPPRQFDPP